MSQYAGRKLPAPEHALQQPLSYRSFLPKQRKPVTRALRRSITRSKRR